MLNAACQHGELLSCDCALGDRRGEPVQHQNRKCFIIRCLFPSSCTTLSVIHQSQNEHNWVQSPPSSFTRLLVFFLTVKEEHLFKWANLRNYCSPKHNGPAFRLAVELVPRQVLFRSNVDRHTAFHLSLYKLCIQAGHRTVKNGPAVWFSIQQEVRAVLCGLHSVLPFQWLQFMWNSKPNSEQKVHPEDETSYKWNAVVKLSCIWSPVIWRLFKCFNLGPIKWTSFKIIYRALYTIRPTTLARLYSKPIHYAIL